MTLTLFMLLQITVLLAVGLGVSVAMQSSLERAHRILNTTLICVVTVNLNEKLMVISRFLVRADLLINWVTWYQLKITPDTPLRALLR